MGNSYVLNQLYLPVEDVSKVEKRYNKTDESGRKFQSISLTQQGQGGAKRFGDRLIDPPNGMHWIWSQEI